MKSLPENVKRITAVMSINLENLLTRGSLLGDIYCAALSLNEVSKNLLYAPACDSGVCPGARFSPEFVFQNWH